MWLQLGLVGGAVLIAAAVVKRLMRRKPSGSRIDVGSVSDAWLAEHRASRNDH